MGCLALGESEVEWDLRDRGGHQPGGHGAQQVGEGEDAQNEKVASEEEIDVFFGENLFKSKTLS